MKGLVTILASILMVSTSLMAGGVASSSLSGSRPYDNPAVQGFDPHTYEVSVEQLTYGGVGGTFSRNSANLAATYSLLFFGADAKDYTAGSEKRFYLGLGGDSFSFAISQKTQDSAGGSDTYSGSGGVLRLFETLYFGGRMEKGSGDLYVIGLGLAVKVDQTFRVDVSSTASTDALLSITTTTSTEIEYQWENFIIGLSDEKIGNAKQTVTYIGWEPDKEGMTAALGILNSNVPGASGGTYLSLGYYF